MSICPFGFTKALEVYDFSGAQESDGIDYVRILDHAEDIIVGASGLLLWCDVVRATDRVCMLSIKNSSE